MKFSVPKKLLSFLLSAIIIFASVAIFQFEGDADITSSDILSKISDSCNEDFSNPFEISTLYDGRIWKTKTVANNILSDIVDKDAEDAEFYSTDNDDEFVVALSALAQAFKTTEQIIADKKANIVLAIDVSSSMKETMLMQDGTTISRINLLKSVALEFVDTLALIGDEHTVNISIVTYSTVGKIKLKWINLISSSAKSVKNIINGLSPEGGTNMQSGAYLVNYMYDNFTKTQDGFTDLALDDEYTSNFVLFMSDGAPNRCYSTDSVPMGTNETLSTNLTAVAASSDYKKISAEKVLEQVEHFRIIGDELMSNMTVFSLGLGEWFTPIASNSDFPTAVNMCKLIAAVGNGFLSAEEADVFLGTDVPDGLMPGMTRPTYPELHAENFYNSSTNKYALSYTVNTSGSTRIVSFNTFEELLTAAETDSKWMAGDLETRKTHGIYSIPGEISDQIVNYYAGNTVEKFKESFASISFKIQNSFSDFITDITKYNSPELDGNIIFNDHIGEYMEVRKMKTLRYNGVTYLGIPFAKTFNANNFDEKSDEFHTEVYDTVIKCFSHELDTSFSYEAARELFLSAMKAGELYYNDDNDYSSSVVTYTAYDSERDLYRYLGSAYDIDGNPVDAPEEATHKTKVYFLLDSVKNPTVTEKDESLMYLVISVNTELATGLQTVRFKIPAALLPVRQVLENDNGTPLDRTDDYAVSNGMKAIHLVYTVGPKKGLSVDRDYEYINSDGTFSLYSNAFEDGLVTASYFYASLYNPFYSLKKGSQLYELRTDAVTGENTYVQATEYAPGRQYYYYRDYVDKTGFHYYYQRVVLPEIITDDMFIITDGVLCNNVTIPKIYKYAATDEFKDVNYTDTYQYDHFGVRSLENDVLIHVDTYLGNNGKLTLPSKYLEPEPTTETVPETTTENVSVPETTTENVSAPETTSPEPATETETVTESATPLYIVTDKGKGYDITVNGKAYTSWATFEVPTGGSFSFTVNLYPMFRDSSFIVMANGKPISPANGFTFTLENMSEDTVITVLGVSKNKFSGVIKWLKELFESLSRLFAGLSI